MSSPLVATRVRRNPWWTAVGLSPLLVAVAAIAGAVGTASADPVRLVLPSLALTLFLSARIWTRNRSPRVDVDEAVVDGDALRFGGEVIAERRHIRRAVWREDPMRGPVVQVHRRLRPGITLALPTADAARALVRDLGFDPGQRTVTFSAMSQVHRVPLARRIGLTLAPIVFGLAVPIGARTLAGPLPLWAGAIATLVFAGSVLASIGWQLAPSRIEVGADGLLIRWLGRTTFLGWSEVEDVEPFEVNEGSRALLGLDVALRDGRRHRIFVRQRGIDDELRELLHARIAEALAHHRRGAPAADVARLARHGRDHAEWLASLRTLGTGADGGPREAPVPLEHLWNLIEDASQHALARTAAAIALARSASPDDRERIRIVARASAEPRLRIALERAADSESDADDAALVEAVAALEDAAPAAGAQRAST